MKKNKKRCKNRKWRYIDPDRNVSPSVISERYGIPVKTFNMLLEEMGIQYKEDDLWHLHKPYDTKGYAKIQTYKTPQGIERTTLQWTPQGQRFLYEILKLRGIVPVKEL